MFQNVFRGAETTKKGSLWWGFHAYVLVLVKCLSHPNIFLLFLVSYYRKNRGIYDVVNLICGGIKNSKRSLLIIFLDNILN